MRQREHPLGKAYNRLIRIAHLSGKPCWPPTAARGHDHAVARAALDYALAYVETWAGCEWFKAEWGIAFRRALRGEAKHVFKPKLPAAELTAKRLSPRHARLKAARHAAR